eukprot:scaffold241262_cov31-Tisochrysis_lutea.AAC.2
MSSELVGRGPDEAADRSPSESVVAAGRRRCPRGGWRRDVAVACRPPSFTGPATSSGHSPQACDLPLHASAATRAAASRAAASRRSASRWPPRHAAAAGTDGELPGSSPLALPHEVAAAWADASRGAEAWACKARLRATRIALATHLSTMPRLSCSALAAFAATRAICAAPQRRPTASYRANHTFRCETNAHSSSAVPKALHAPLCPRRRTHPSPADTQPRAPVSRRAPPVASARAQAAAYSRRATSEGSLRARASVSAEKRAAAAPAKLEAPPRSRPKAAARTWRRSTAGSLAFSCAPSAAVVVDEAAGPSRASDVRRVEDVVLLGSGCAVGWTGRFGKTTRNGCWLEGSAGKSSSSAAVRAAESAPTGALRSSWLGTKSSSTTVNIPWLRGILLTDCTEDGLHTCRCTVEAWGTSR